MKLETIKGYKLTLKPFFKENSRFAIFGHFWLKKDPKNPKIGVLDLCAKGVISHRLMDGYLSVLIP